MKSFANVSDNAFLPGGLVRIAKVVESMSVVVKEEKEGTGIYNFLSCCKSVEATWNLGDSSGSISANEGVYSGGS